MKISSIYEYFCNRNAASREGEVNLATHLTNELRNASVISFSWLYWIDRFDVIDFFPILLSKNSEAETWSQENAQY